MQNAKLVYDGYLLLLFFLSTSIMMGIQEDDKHIGLGELDLILASCTPIYHLCLMKPKEYTPSLLAILCKGIKVYSSLYRYHWLVIKGEWYSEQALDYVAHVSQWHRYQYEP